jgi:hypothetical protein
MPEKKNTANAIAAVMHNKENFTLKPREDQ